MDPRHPEQAISRMRELMKQYDRIEADMSKATTSAKLAQLEREGGLVVQEICLVAPRIHEAMMQASRQRRYDLSHGIAFSYTPEEKVGKYTKATIGIEEKLEEKPVEELVMDNTDVIGEENIGGESVSVKKLATKNVTKKKTTKKKKTAKKAE